MEPIDLIRIEGKLDRILALLEYRQNLEANKALEEALNDGLKHLLTTFPKPSTKKPPKRKTDHRKPKDIPRKGKLRRDVSRKR